MSTAMIIRASMSPHRVSRPGNATSCVTLFSPWPAKESLPFAETVPRSPVLGGCDTHFGKSANDIRKFNIALLLHYVRTKSS